jgi:predicted RNase H-like HicB family nuclease
MSGKSAKPSKTSNAAKKTTRPAKPAAADAAALDRPFDQDVLKQAQQLAQQYRYTVEHDADEGVYVGASVEMPYVMADAPTPGECVAAALAAHAAAVATLLERGETPPAPASDGKRDRQLNIRLSAHEKHTLESAAQREGFRTVSDFVRHAAMRAAT